MNFIISVALINIILPVRHCCARMVQQSDRAAVMPKA